MAVGWDWGGGLKTGVLKASRCWRRSVRGFDGRNEGPRVEDKGKGVDGEDKEQRARFVV